MRAGPRARRPIPLLEAIETQRLGCELAGSSLYSSVLGAVSADVVSGGPCASVLAPAEGAPFGDAVMLRFLAGLHRLVLAGDAPLLAEHYPSAGGEPGPGLAAAVVDAVEQHRPSLVDAMARNVQTNEPGRSVTLLGGYLVLARLGLPLRIREVGASAGLNLLFDRYRYSADDGAFGPVDSPLVFERPWVGRTPDLSAPLSVADRSGCDVDPIDLSTPSGRLWLRSFVWADHPERLDRLDAALAVASAVGQPSVERADAVDWVRCELAELQPGTCTVVSHSIVFQYLDPEAGKELVGVVERAGLRARPDAPLAWLRMEPGGDRAELRLTVWPDGSTVSLATSAYHGPPVAWTAPEHLPWLSGSRR